METSFSGSWENRRDNTEYGCASCHELKWMETWSTDDVECDSLFPVQP